MKSKQSRGGIKKDRQTERENEKTKLSERTKYLYTQKGVQTNKESLHSAMKQIRKKETETDGEGE